MLAEFYVDVLPNESIGTLPGSAFMKLLKHDLLRIAIQQLELPCSYMSSSNLLFRVIHFTLGLPRDMRITPSERRQAPDEEDDLRFQESKLLKESCSGVIYLLPPLDA
ncbi:hypothetical protein Tco_0983799 [Tanacetum coccineum]